MDAQRRFTGPLAGWAVWTLPRRALVPVLLVEITAVALLTFGLTSHRTLTGGQIWLLVALCGLGIAHSEVATGVERLRRRVTEGNHVDLSSVWTFAMALVLPAGWAALGAILVHGYIWWRAWRPRAPLYRHLFSTATVSLACLGAAVTFEGVGGGLGAIVVALLVYTTINSALVAGAIATSDAAADLAAAFGHWDDNVLEIATLSLGGLVAAALAVNPWLVLLVFPPLLVLHRSVLVRQLEEAASTDGKTGLLNAATWHTRADRELQRVAVGGGPRAVLVLDLDRFKAVNDTHGHLAGDLVLAAVADAVRSEVRDRDLVGRFGGEEFVVLLAGGDDGDEADLEAVADRIRRRVAALRVEVATADGPLTIAGLSVSVGGAVHAGGVGDLGELLQIADTALYSAKRSGRNMVRMGSTPALPPPLPMPHPVGDAPPAGDAR